MKKLFVILSISMFLFSCTNKKTWEFTKQENEKNQGFNFENLITQVKKIPLQFLMNTLDVLSLVVLKNNDILFDSLDR